jgi:hypothetical protein
MIKPNSKNTSWKLKESRRAITRFNSPKGPNPSSRSSSIGIPLCIPRRTCYIIPMGGQFNLISHGVDLPEVHISTWCPFPARERFPLTLMLNITIFICWI